MGVSWCLALMISTESMSMELPLVGNCPQSLWYSPLTQSPYFTQTEVYPEILVHYITFRSWKESICIISVPRSVQYIYSQSVMPEINFLQSGSLLYAKNSVQKRTSFCREYVSQNIMFHLYNKTHSSYQKANFCFKMFE